MSGHWTRQSEITSVRAERAIAFGDKLADIVNGKVAEGWDALLPLIDAERFVRRGNERAAMNWPVYCAMLDQWDGQSRVYEKHLHRATEAGNVVYLDLDERNVANDGKETTLRSISIYEFDEADRIVAVDICMGFHKPK